MNKKRLKALIRLLDDPDQLVYETVEKELLKADMQIIPALERQWENSFDENSQERIENIIQDLQFNHTLKLLKLWLADSSANLLDGYLVIDRFQYPDLNEVAVKQKIDNIKNEIWLELNDSLTILEKITVVNHFLFTNYGFKINHNNMQSPQNCYLNQVLDTKNANPNSLSLLYLLLLQGLGLSAKLVDFPRNPLVAIVDSELALKVHGKRTKTDVLFYVNPSNKGSVASRKEVRYHLKKFNFLPQEKFSEPKPDKLFLRRLLETLSESFHDMGFTEKEERVSELIHLF